jgi:hypothetical protein
MKNMLKRGGYVRLLLVWLCFSLFLMCVTVSPSYATVHPLCPPENTVSGTATYPPIQTGKIVINEVLSNPGSHTLWNCTTQMNSPWLELFNTQNQAYDLSSFAALDRGPGTARYYFTGNSRIAAHGYFVIFPSIFIFQSQTPLLRLLFEGVAVDEVTIPALGIDQSYARMPDGSQSWQSTNTPTIGASNTSSMATATPTVPKSATGTAQVSKGRQQQPGINNSTHSAPIELQQPSTQQNTTRNQPAWSNLHLPQPDTRVSSTPDAVAYPSTPISKATPTPWPLFAVLLGVLSFSGLLGIIYYKYKRRQKAT